MLLSGGGLSEQRARRSVCTAFRLNRLATAASSPLPTLGVSSVIARPAACLIVVTLVAGASGCHPPPEELRQYTIPKQAAVDEMGGADRMLAAAVLQPGQAWFFKLVGPEAAVKDQEQPFTDLLKSLRFKGAGATPEWKLPEGWHELPSTPNRYATLETSGDQPLEVAVTALDRRDDDDAGYLLANVNRWRKQMGADEITASGLEQERRIDAGGTTATLVDLVGRMRSAPMGGAPFADSAHPPMDPDLASGASREKTLQHAPEKPAAGRPQGNGTPRLRYETPAGWSELPAKGMSMANFTAGKGPSPAQVTLIPLGSEAGDLLANVNRWRGQIGLPPIERDEAERQAEPIDVGQGKGSYIRLVGPERSILAVLYSAGNSIWFITLKGGNDVVAGEIEHFQSFVHSLTIDAS
jgi:hypothetical protein